MNQPAIPRLPEHILKTAAEYVKEKHGINADRELLNELYWNIRWRTQQLRKANQKDPTLKVSTGFYAVREWILDQRFPQRGPPDSRTRRAYASGLGKIGSEMRKLAQPRLNLKRSEYDRMMDRVTLSKDRRQYRIV